MVRTIWKYPLGQALGSIALGLPSGAIVRHFAVQDGAYTIWAEVDPTALLTTRRFLILPTGGPIDEPGRTAHLATTIDGPYVWHLFERA